MRWLFATVAVLVGGCVGACAIYTWGWRSDRGSGTLALLHAESVNFAFCLQSKSRTECLRERATRSEHVAARVWRVAVKDINGDEFCFLVDLDHFLAKVASKFSFEGIGPTRC